VSLTLWHFLEQALNLARLLESRVLKTEDVPLVVELRDRGPGVTIRQ
jgi:hypothetical protein